VAVLLGGVAVPPSLPPAPLKRRRTHARRTPEIDATVREVLSQGYTQAQAAEYAGVSQTSVSRIVAEAKKARQEVPEPAPVPPPEPARPTPKTLAARKIEDPRHEQIRSIQGEQAIGSFEHQDGPKKKYGQVTKVAAELSDRDQDTWNFLVDHEGASGVTVRQLATAKAITWGQAQERILTLVSKGYARRIGRDCYRATA
jgi:ribulose bisphosphate carboxylase small subunit